MITIRPWEDDAGAWDAIAGADVDGTFAHLYGWRRVMADALGHRPVFLGAIGEAGKLEGILPLVQVRSALFGHYLMSMPFLNAGGPLGSPRAREALTARAVDLARAARVDLLELRTPGSPPEGLRVSTRKVTHVLPLPADATTLWQRLPSKLRSQIRRPEKEGLVARAGSGERTGFYDVFSRHMRALGTPVLPERWFSAIAAAFPNEAVFVTVYDGATPVAGGCGFIWRGGCEITWASARREWARAAPNMLLYWTFLQHAIARGCTAFDFGRCTPGSSTHAFKRQWGGEDRPLRWGQWRAGGVSATPSPERGVFRLAAACWQRLPLAVTNRLGPVLARQIP